MCHISPGRMREGQEIASRARAATTVVGANTVTRSVQQVLLRKQVGELGAAAVVAMLFAGTLRRGLS